ncbi:hypothetical protein GVX82_00290 [Patescibacteria group bacterium]|jgi:hypothetical protein|nr:hypothetical protein [Patescibacteria group bacterium]
MESAEEILAELKEQRARLEAIERSLRQARRFFLISIWVTVIAFMLPLLLLLIIIPIFLNRYLAAFQGLI